MVALREELAERERAYSLWVTDRHGRLALPRDLRRESEIVVYYMNGGEVGTVRNRAYNANSTSLLVDQVESEIENKGVTEVLSDSESLGGGRKGGEDEVIGEEEEEEREEGRTSRRGEGRVGRGGGRGGGSRGLECHGG